MLHVSLGAPFKFENVHWVLPTSPYLANPWLYSKDTEDSILHVPQHPSFACLLHHDIGAMGEKGTQVGRLGSLVKLDTTIAYTD